MIYKGSKYEIDFLPNNIIPFAGSVGLRKQEL